ncbi:MAG: hypothetical protein DAHOPDDO_02200 [Ignavibacteriaceae bacterium]|nr:hypothetical protein [Ignavibacteriaceae bacterium]
MNIEKIFSALKNDPMNSAIGIICSEFEHQNYEIEIEGIRISSNEIFENKVPSLEEVVEPLNFKLFKNDNLEQKFSITFTDFHKVVFQEYRND